MRHHLTALLLFLLIAAQSFGQITLNPTPSRVIGQTSTQIRNLNPNLVEGRELFAPQGIALDTSTNPPGLYVSDTGNNRVLGFRSAPGFVNGQPADVVLGQPDPVTTLPAGPSLANTPNTGVNQPSGIAVDLQGNVYVVDSGNNRVLRFPKPLGRSGAQAPDLVLGQPSFATGSVNQGGVSASSLAFSNSSSVLRAFITFDSAGNLWVSDAANNRVLRFNANVLGGQAASGPAADLVLGQPDFVSNGYNPSGANPALSLTAFTTPTGIAFDFAGRLFVSETVPTGRGRILMWTPPFATGQAAAGLLGVDTSVPAPSNVNAHQLLGTPGDLFSIGNSIGIADTNDNRLLVFPPVEQWTANATYQNAIEVVGQTGFSSNTANEGFPTATASTLYQPASAVFFNAELYVVDSSNNRVIVMPQNGGSFGPAIRVLGQDTMSLNAPNLVEGREFDFINPGNGGGDAGIAVDLSSNPPHLYVADTYNNRVLAYKDLRNLAAGGKADLVIGQPDFQQTLINYPTNDPSTANSSGLFAPIGMVVDSAGNLYVADTGNGRVLRFPAPFAHYTPGTPEQADLVLGQISFTASKVSAPTQSTMAQPYGLAFTHAGGLLVSDQALNRVLYFQGQPADLRSGMAAALVLGQPDFASSGKGSGSAQLFAPHHIATDSNDRIYVTDPGNRRVLIYNSVATLTSGAAASYALTSSLSSPRGIYVSDSTGEVWVSDAVNNVAVRFPAFDQLVNAGGAPNGNVADLQPLALVEDGWGDLFVADAANRVVTFYPHLVAINAANFLTPNGLAPGMIAAMYSQGNANQFGVSAVQATVLPLPNTLNGVQILFNHAPVPLFYAGPNQINFQVPMGAPQSGSINLQVVEVATGRLLGEATAIMNTADPGVFTQSGNGIGTAVAVNEDNTLNSVANQAYEGSIITLYGTGQGFIAGAPADGDISNTALQTPSLPTVIIGTAPVPSSNIKYSGLAPTLVGVWQINVQIPLSVITTPTMPTQVVVIQGQAPSGGGGLGRTVQIYVKQKK